MIESILEKIPYVSSIEVIRTTPVARYFFRVHGFLTWDRLEKIIKVAEGHGLEFEGLTSRYEAINVVFRRDKL